VQELATNEKLIEDLSEALDTRGAEAAAARAAHERARHAIAQRDTREARVAAALARADAQTSKLEALCLRTERASAEHVSMLQRSVRDLRARCESLGASLTEERTALAAVAAKAEAVAAREREARGAESEANVEAIALAEKLRKVQVHSPPPPTHTHVLSAVPVPRSVFSACIYPSLRTSPCLPPAVIFMHRQF
jgi:chromosome segregation ATPase